MILQRSLALTVANARHAGKQHAQLLSGLSLFSVPPSCLPSLRCLFATMYMDILALD